MTGGAASWCARRIGVLALAGALAAPAGANDFLPGADDAATIEAAIEAERPEFAPPAGVTGIAVPHHLLAADLIARGFWAASAGEYDRIVLLAPDHFHLVGSAFGVGAGDRTTLLGTVPADHAGVRRLLRQPRLFEPHRDIGAEHAVGAVLPFVARFFPGVPVVAVVASEHAGAEEWGAAVEALAPLVGERTLVVQSTDYAHYLPAADAVLRDQETLAAIAEARPERVAAMLQPAHMDAKAAQHMQMALQARLGAASAVVANRNSVEYGGDPASTTSYMVTVYHRDAGALSRLVYPDQQVLHFGGDVLLGRHVQPLLGDAEAMAPVLQAAHAATGGGALVVNLEGVLADAPIAGAPATVAPDAPRIGGSGAALPRRRRRLRRQQPRLGLRRDRRRDDPPRARGHRRDAAAARRSGRPRRGADDRAQCTAGPRSAPRRTGGGDGALPRGGGAAARRLRPLGARRDGRARGKRAPPRRGFWRAAASRWRSGRTAMWRRGRSR